MIRGVWEGGKEREREDWGYLKGDKVKREGGKVKGIWVLGVLIICV